MKTVTRAIRVMLDLEKCVACKTCEMACAVAHSEYQTAADAVLAGAHLATRIKVRAIDDQPVPVQCQQCADAPCLAACPTGALYRDEPAGPVLVEQVKCIACGACTRVCPYGAVHLDAVTKQVIKCDACASIMDRVDGPCCVQACPTSALIAVTDREQTAPALQREFDALVRDETRPGSVGPGVLFTIRPSACICCGRCAKACPVNCIEGKAGRPPARATDADRQKGRVGEPFRIDQNRCVHCGSCFEVCPVGAVERSVVGQNGSVGNDESDDSANRR